MTIDIISFLRKLMDVLLVWLFVYYILKNIRNNVRFILLFKGIAFIFIIKLLSDILGLTAIGLLLEYVIMWGPLAIIIIFQPEIRNVLEQLGRTQLLGRHKVLTMDEREKLVYEVISAVEYLKKARIGALMVIERDISLNEYIESSKKIYADISGDLLVSIFFPNNPLHDGGVIIQGDRITSAIGISEETDAIALIVSEETGRVSIAMGGELNYNLSLDEARMMLIEELRPKKDLLLDEQSEEKEDENEEKENNA